MAIHVRRHFVSSMANNKSDIRQSIVRRLMGYTAERRRLESRLGVIGELEKELQDVLREIDQREQGSLLKPDESSVFSSQEANNGAVKEWLQTILRNGSKTLDQIVSQAQEVGISFGDKAPARVLHFNLLNLKNGGMIEKDGEAWKLASGKYEKEYSRIMATVDLSAKKAD
jgi:hypothetical protein